MENFIFCAVDVTFKDNGPFKSCILKINKTLINGTEDLEIVMPICNLIEYSHDYCMTSGHFWNYYRDKIDDVDDSSSEVKSFKYKTKIKGKTPAQSP